MSELVIKIIEDIKSGSIKDSEYFKVAKIVNNLLTDDSSVANEQGRRIIIYLLNYWDNIPEGYRSIFTDLIAKCGFFPYLEKEKNKLKLDDLNGEIKKELHKSDYITNPNSDLYFHAAQKEVSDILLNSEDNLIVSAPTSFGKSLLIEEIVASSKYNNIVIIQPTLALLNETRNNLRKYEYIYKIIVRVSDRPSEEKKNLFLLTAERVMEYKDLPKIDFFVLDEFYKLSQKRHDERYDILNNACNKLLNQHRSRFYFLGPNIDDVSQEFIEKYKVKFMKYTYSLVINEEEEIKDGDNYYSDNKNIEMKENRLFKHLSNLSDQTIIYCSSPNMSTRTSINFAKYLDSLEKKYINNKDSVPLIDWLTENFSYKFDLISCLKHGIGLHNGAFPKHINAAIIDYFNEGKLKYLFCTSTIIEGVNTSAKNVILFNNWRGKPDNKIDYFDYKNIRGRSGRMFRHYIGILYSFYEKLEEQKMRVDVPFIDQIKPLNKEILAQTEPEDIKDTTSKEYEELTKLPPDELNLFKKNGLSIDGQKAILDYITVNFDRDYEYLSWVRYPKFKDSEYILNLCMKHFKKPTETGGNNVSAKKLATIINSCNYDQSLSAIIKNEIKYYHDILNKNYNEALINALQIQRHWFDYRLPKWFGCFNEIQKFVCEKKGVKSGDFSYFLALLENDYMSSRANMLMEFDLPNTAIRKLDKSIPAQFDEERFIELIRRSPDMILHRAGLNQYEMERVKKELL